MLARRIRRTMLAAAATLTFGVAHGGDVVETPDPFTLRTSATFIATSSRAVVLSGYARDPRPAPVMGQRARSRARSSAGVTWAVTVPQPGLVSRQWSTPTAMVPSAPVG